MFALIAATYVLHLISRSEWPSRKVDRCARQLSKPATLSLARDGSVAMMIGDIGSNLILIRHSDGSRERVPLPPARMLASTFTESYQPGTNRYFTSLAFSGVRIVNDVTLFASIVNTTDGAAISTERSVFGWNGRTWQKTPAHNAMPVDTDGQAVGVEVAAVDTQQRVALNGIYGTRFVPAVEDRTDPDFLNDQAEFTDGARVIPLGVGTATGMRGTTVVGFQAGLNVVTPSCRNPRRTYAVEWLNGAPERLLGNGISYDVNVHDQVVGDNELLFGTSGQPVMWSNGREAILDRRHGSAYAIADDGTIVGSVNDSAFIIDGRRPHSGVQLLDRRISDHSWHIRAAYGVISTGRILALAVQHGNSHVVVLDPQ